MEYAEIILSEEEKEINDIEIQEEEESISLERYAFNSFRIERSIRDILNWVEKGKIIIPEFQRDFVWNYNQSSRFVESVLLGLPIPDFFMFRLIDNKGQFEKYILIDGLQRYTTIKQFVEGKFVQGETNRTFKINNKSSQWFNKTYAKLDTNDQDYFQDYSLKINVFDSVEDSERMQKLYMTTIFERINTGSTKLSAQEVRNAIFIGETVRDIRTNAKNEDFSHLLQADLNKYSQRCKKEEFYLRLLAYYHVYLQITKKSSLYIDTDKESKISSSKDLMLCNFLFYCNKNDISFYPGIEVQNVKKDTLFDSFSKKRMAARALNKRIAYNYDYKLTTFERIKGTSAILVSPGKYDSMLNGAVSDLSGYGIQGLSVGK